MTPHNFVRGVMEYLEYIYIGIYIIGIWNVGMAFQQRDVSYCARQ